MLGAEDVIAFWVDEVGPKGWFGGGDALDQQIRDRFGEAWEAAVAGAFGLWLTSARGTLGYIILVDQFPRNMFREDPRAFSTDSNARAAAKVGLARNWDFAVDTGARPFFYMPLMHSENLIDQDRCVRLVHSRLPGDESTLLHARAHREVIRKFARFPFRNAALGRQNTPGEQAFLDDGGYGGLLKRLQQTDPGPVAG